MGRADKKFCSDGCRNSHNNTLNKDSSNLVRNINNRLRKITALKNFEYQRQNQGKERNVGKTSV